MFCSGVAPSACLDQLRRIAGDGRRAVELVFFSAAETARFGGGHRVIVPPVEIPTLPQSTADLIPAARDAFRIGIVGQTCHAVLEPDAEDCTQLRHCCDELAIYDPGRFRFTHGDARNVIFVPRKPGALNSFLSGLDALVLQPRVWYYEGGMHEFFGARALGVPVLCPKASRWAEYIDDGVDGLCYESQDQLLRLLGELRTAPGRAEDMGAAARNRVLAELDPERMRRTYAEWIGGVPPRSIPGGNALQRAGAA